MDLYIWLIIFAALFPFIVRLDYKEKQKADADPDKSYDYNRQLLSMVLVFMPYSLLFYTDDFWNNILLYIPLYLYCLGFLYFTYCKKWFEVPPGLAAFNSLGQFLLVVIAYYLFFHDGVFSEPEVVPELTHRLVNNDEVWWPYGVFAGIWLASVVFVFLARLGRFYQDASMLLIWAALFGLPLLPFFMTSYWGGMLAGLVGVISLLYICSRHEGFGSASFALLYFYILTAFGSMTVYAFLY